MAKEIQELRPVQVFLDTKKFIDRADPKSPPMGNKDFFKDDDRGFARHKQKIRTRVQDVSRALKNNKQPAGFIHVQMRDDALGKSYRPLSSLFTEGNGFALVGAGRIGEMMFQVTPGALDKLDGIIEAKAEITPRLAPNNKTGEMERRISRYRSEVGAIGDLKLHDTADRVSFSAKEAIA